ncbi:MurR/RpiR family transcriptional regulator [Paenibacillus sp. YN15]|uniref:MurR/RpiR family transcriptional regulator n=1 Tax=Paenibacillus sp. YN15 TaxID=1742774 RepID=UPI000DCE4F74|nr:MurR/RpiR family transcriptional regulator [Paenibacillus sp. YN15]RAU97338.1 transcriptional regulator [Paenibacillus sp. YN15]
MTGILHLIRERLPELNPKDREIAAFILEQPELMIRMGIKELSEAANASTASISRFCKLIQTNGYADLKMKIAAELAMKPMPETYQDIVAGNTLPGIVSAIEANHIHSISDTTRLVDYRQLEAVLELLQAAGRIDLYGVATSGIVASDFAQKLIRIGKRAQAFTDPHMQITSASSLGSGDLVIAVSYSGETPEIIDSVRCAKEGGAKAVSLTRYGPNTLAAAADIALFTSSLESGMHRGDMASRIAQLHIIDILFTALLSQQFDEHVPHLERSFQMVNKYRREKGFCQ